MKNYEDMSNFEINKLVALASGKNIKFISVDVDDNEIGVIVGQKHTRQQLPFDPCNNQADAWPIILESHISVFHCRCGLYQAWPTSFGVASKFCTEDANPLRSAMIVFLRMNDREFICDGDNREVCSTYEDDE